MAIKRTNADEISIQVVSPLLTMPAIAAASGALIGPAASCAQAGKLARANEAIAPYPPNFKIDFIL